ncbi:hypothetical protein [Lewinella cohaerens]|uniref:hypothetical protein n=1 Tax=Lewinella cohaerens TaxID=70995 RepID=UPI0003718E5D|nr:hypothetical protein [Lewinella cohaerens]
MTATTEQQLLVAIKQNNLRLMQMQMQLLQLQSSQMIQVMQGSELTPKEAKLQLMKHEFERRAMLPEDSRPPWVCQDEAAWLVGEDLTVTKNHRRKIRWAHQHGHLVITNGGINSLHFLRTEVMVLNQKVISGEVVWPTKFGK